MKHKTNKTDTINWM